MNKYISVFVGLYLYPLFFTKDISRIVSEDPTKIIAGRAR